MAGSTYLEAVREALFEEMSADERVFVMGEDIGVYGGAFKVTDGMLAQFGPDRVIDTPIAEAGIVPVFDIVILAKVAESALTVPLIVAPYLLAVILSVPEGFKITVSSAVPKLAIIL